MRPQRGAVLLVMIVMLIIGLAAALVGSLSVSGIKTARQAASSTALAQAKEALIAYAVHRSNRPGELPCPDTIGDGSASYGSGCSSYVGYLPWKDLGLPELRDGAGEKLWYALSTNFYAGNSVNIDSDTQGQLSITGKTNMSNVVAIIFAPGTPLCGQTHATSSLDQYLEAMSSVTATTASDKTFSDDCSASPYNDQMLAITADQILQPVEKRIAREAKACLESYSSASGGKYPWAAVVANIPQRPSKSPNYFGRFPDGIDPSLIQGDTQDFIDALNNLQTQLNNFAQDNPNTLDAAGHTLENLASPAPAQIYNKTGNQAKTTGKEAQKLANDKPGYSVSSVQELINATQASLADNLALVASAPYFDNCLLLRAIPSGTPAKYWDTWKDLLFYQVASGSTSNPGSCSTCLSIQGGNNTNRAVVIVAGKKLVPLRIQSDATTYLELDNLLPKVNAANQFKTYRPTDPAYQTINDVVQCVDSQDKCK
jgi:hypothetical protein